MKQRIEEYKIRKQEMQYLTSKNRKFKKVAKQIYKQNYSCALTNLEQILQEDSHRDHYFLLGLVALRRNKYNFACSTLEKAIELGYDKDPLVFSSLALANLKMNRIQNALENWNKYFSIANKPTFDEYYEYGNTLRLNSNIDEANKYLNKAVKLSEDPKVKTIWQLYKSKEHWDVAIDYLAYDLEQAPDNTKLKFELSNLYFYLFEYQKSEKLLLELIEVDPRQNYYTHLIRIYENLNQFEKAIEIWGEVNLDKIKNKNFYLYRKGYAFANAGKFKEAAVIFNEHSQYVDLPSENTEISKYYSKGILAYNQNQYDLAADLFKKASFETETLIPHLFSMLGNSYFQLGRFEEACSAYIEQKLFKKNSGMTSGPLRKEWFKRNATYAEVFDYSELDSDIFFYCSYNGSNFTGSPYALFKELYSKPNSVHIIAINDEGVYPTHVANLENVHIVTYDSYAHMKALSTAATLIINTSLPFYFQPKEGQKILNTWHGTPLKTLGYEVEELGYYSSRNVQKSLRVATHIINPNQFTEDVITRSYTLNKQDATNFAVTGYPRQDLMLNATEERKQEIRDYLEINDGKKIVLYAPTYRGSNNEANDSSHPQMEKLIKELKKGTDYHLLYKGHYFEKNTDKRLSTIDTNELLSIVDVLITDYSSIGIDFLAMDKPIIYYTFDIEEYLEERGMYIKPEEIADLITTKPLDTVKLVNEQVVNPCVTAKQQAAKKRFNSHDDGMATKRVVQFLDSDVKEPENDKKDVLIYSGNFFLMNGISRAFENLINSFDKNEYRINILLQDALLTDEEEYTLLNKLYSEGYDITIAYGTDNLTLQENYAKNKFNQNRRFYNETHKQIYLQGVHRNAQRLFGNKEFDALINYESAYTQNMNALLAATAAKKRIFVLHNDMLGEAMMKYPHLINSFALYDEYDHLLSVSEACSNENYQKIGTRYNIAKEKFGTLNNIIDYKAILENAKLPLEVEADETLFDTDSKVFITIGRLSPEKNHKLAIESFAKVLETSEDKNIKLLIMGGGLLEVETKSLINGLGLNDNVIMLGLRANPFNYLKKADCFIFPSLHEGQGLVLLESLIVNTPIITTDIPTSVEIVNAYGGVYTEATTEQFTKAIQEYLAGNTLETNTYDPQKYNENILDILYSAISN